ncbi:MAG: diguanylate cyclase, partial [Halothiobacillaceae bacterium]
MDNQTAMGEWREKYLLHLQESERKEQRWAQSEELLRRTLSRVTLVAEGIDQDLDGSLSALRQSLRDRAASEILETELERLAVAITHYETRDKAGLVVTPAGVLLALLDSITWPQPLRRQVKTVRSKIKERRYPAELVPLLPECAGLLSHAVGSNRPPEGDAVDSPGFFSKLFGAEPRRSSGVAAAESLATSVALLEQILTPLMETLVRNKVVNSSIFWERYREQLQAASNHEALLCVADELVVALATA